MERHSYARVRRLDECLHKAGVAEDTIARIMEGGKSLAEKTLSADKADWLAGAMLRMDEVLAPDLCHMVREGCACCLGGKRLAISKSIARENQTLEDRIRAANEAKFVFGHSVTLKPEGKVLVCFAPDGLEHYGCPCLPKAREPMPLTYCYCCGGHVKHHLQTALGRKLNVTVLHTALSTGGVKPCTFEFEFAR